MENGKLTAVQKGKEMLERMEREAGRELLSFGEKKPGQIAKEVVKKAAGRYVPPRDRIFWPAGLLAEGLFSNMHRSGQTREGKERIRAELQIFFERWLEDKMPVYCVDDVLCGTVLLELYQETGEEKYRLGADRLADYLSRLAWESADREGSIPYRPLQKTGHIYADSLGMICPFLTAYSRMSGQQEMTELALCQLKNMLAHGMEKSSGLPYHGFHLESGIKYGIIGWGRAVGWLLMGLTGSLLRLDPEHPEYAGLITALEQLVRAVLPWQKENGAFAWQLQALEGPEDSSATAMIAGTLCQALSVEECREAAAGILEETCEAVASAGMFPDGLPLGPEIRQSLKLLVGKAAAYLGSCEQEGRIGQASGECEGFSRYPQVYGCYPWSLGPALGLFARCFP